MKRVGTGPVGSKKTGEKEPLLGGRDATVPCGVAKFVSNSNFKQI
jgi:hypothetical protein